MVKAIVNGKRQLVSLDIDESILKVSDKIFDPGFVIAAVNKANEEAETQAREQLKKSTDGLLPNIPGMDLSSLMG